MAQSKTVQRKRRHARIRAQVSGTADKPRVSVFRSNRYIYVQAIDDTAGKTIASAWTRQWKDMPLADAAREVGKAIAEKLKTHKIEKAVFDRGGFIYTGNIARVAEGLREGGLRV